MRADPDELKRIVADDYYRPPAWRWERVRELNGIKANPTREDDKLVPAGLNFRQMMDKADTKSRLQRVQLKHPGLFVAFKTYENADSFRWQMEALLLSAAERDEIAAFLGTSERVIEAYELYFYDIRDRRQSPGYIGTHLLEPAIVSELDRYDRDFLWKAVGYFGGKDALYSLWSMGKLTPEAEAFFRDTISGKIGKDALKAIYTREINKFTASEVIGQWLKQRELDIQVAAVEGGMGGTSHLDTAQELISCIHFTIAQENPDIHFVDGKRAEFRANEMLTLPVPKDD